MEQAPRTDLPADAALALAALIRQALPLAEELVNNGSAEDRGRFRQEADSYTLHELRMRLVDLTSERSYRERRGLPTEEY